MSKLVILGTITATGIVATAVPAALLTGNSNKPGVTKQFIPKLTSASDIREKNKYKEVECLKNYFGEIEFTGSGKTTNPTLNKTNNFSSDAVSCLIVEYEKQTYEEDKWKGEFRLIWAVKDNNQGLVTITSARTKDEDGKIWGNSAAYALKKNSSNNSWTTQHVQEIHLSWKAEEYLKKLIPQASSSMPGSVDKEKYWGFDPNLQKICKKDDCQIDSKETRNSYYWEFLKSDDGAAVYSWTDKASEWLQQIFAWQELINKMSSVKGKWQVKAL